MDAICGWAEMRREEVRSAMESRRKDPAFGELVQRAKAKGFRPASLYEALELSPADLFTWRNEIWVRHS